MSRYPTSFSDLSKSLLINPAGTLYRRFSVTAKTVSIGASISPAIALPTFSPAFLSLPIPLKSLRGLKIAFETSPFKVHFIVIASWIE